MYIYTVARTCNNCLSHMTYSLLFKYISEYLSNNIDEEIQYNSDSPVSDCCN